MRSDGHERARWLIRQSAVEGCAAADAAWLDVHLAGCADCAREVAVLASVVTSLRDVSTPAPPGLASRTRVALRRHAEAAGQQRSYPLLWAALAFSMVSMAVTLPFAWWMCEWLGHTLGLPNPIWQAGFLASWFFPATVTAVVLAWLRPADASGFGPGQAYT